MYERGDKRKQERGERRARWCGEGGERRCRRAGDSFGPPSACVPCLRPFSRCVVDGWVRRVAARALCPHLRRAGLSLDPWEGRQQGTAGRCRAGGPVTVCRPGRPCWRPWPPRASRVVAPLRGSSSEGARPRGKVGSNAVVRSVTRPPGRWCVRVCRLGRPNCALVGLFVNQVRRVPSLVLPLSRHLRHPHQCKGAFLLCACRMPARLARPSAHFVTVGKAPSRGRVQLLYEREICMLLRCTRATTPTSGVVVPAELHIDQHDGL